MSGIFPVDSWSRLVVLVGPRLSILHDVAHLQRNTTRRNYESSNRAWLLRVCSQFVKIRLTAMSPFRKVVGCRPTSLRHWQWNQPRPRRVFQPPSPSHEYLRTSTNVVRCHRSSRGSATFHLRSPSGHPSSLLALHAPSIAVQFPPVFAETNSTALLPTPRHATAAPQAFIHESSSCPQPPTPAAVVVRRSSFVVRYTLHDADG